MTATDAIVFDPYAYETHEDPYPLYARLREEAPLYHNAEQGFWALSRYDDVMEAFRDSTRFSSAEGVSLDPAATGRHAHRTMSFLAMDPPRHGRMRGLVSRGFTPRRVAELEPRIRALAVEHLDAAVADDSFDFIGAFAGKLPMDVISELVGVPPADRDEVRRLADLLVHREDGVMDVPPEGVEAAFALVVYYTEMLDERRRKRTDDLTSALLDVELDGDRLTDEEIISFLFLLVVAGNETTTKLLGNAWYWAAQHPQEKERAFGGPQAIEGWVEETLRYDTSTQLLARTATCDVALHDGVIPAGDRVVLLVGSANRDPRAFADPDRYDVARFAVGAGGTGGAVDAAAGGAESAATSGATTQSMLASFGMGRHFCMGASLARLEARVALEETVARIADYEVHHDQIKRVHSVNVRGFASLPTTVRRR